MGSKREVGLDPRGPLDYMGPDVALMTISQNDRAPTTTDTHYPLSHHWRIDSSAIAPAVEGDMWYLAKFEANGDADWQKIASGATPGGTVITISDMNSISVPPDIFGDLQLTTAVGSGMTIDAGPGAHQITFALNGGIDVQAHTAPGTDPVVPVAGILTVQGTIVGEHSIPIQTNSLAAGIVNIEVQQSVAVAAADADRSGMCHFNSNHLSCAATGYVDVNPSQSSSATNAALSGISHYDVNDFVVDANGFTQLKNGASVENIGITYNAGTGVFQICSASGAALSASNAGYIIAQSTAVPGSFRRYKIDANHQFVDDTAASTIAGNSFQTCGSSASAMPFWIYAIPDTTKTTIAFAICRLPHCKYAPDVGKCARVGSAVADTQYSMFFLGTPTVADYASQRCVCIGAISMKKTTAAHDWTVAGISPRDGIGQFMDGVWFNMAFNFSGCWNTIPLTAGTSFNDNAGTAAKHTNMCDYSMQRDGIIEFSFSSDISVTGLGVVIAQLSQPYQTIGGGYLSDSTLIHKVRATNTFICWTPTTHSYYTDFILGDNSATLIANSNLVFEDLLFGQWRFMTYSNGLGGGSI